MSTIQALFSEPFFQALGWTLLHFIWQGALVGILFASLNVLLKGCSSNIRYAADCSSMLLMLVLPLATFYIISTSSNRATANQQAQGDASKWVAPVQDTASLPHWQINAPAEIDPDAVLPPEAMRSDTWAEDSFASILPWLVLIWLAGALILSLRFLGGWVAAQKLKFRRTILAARDWQEMVTRLSSRLRLTRPVRLCESALVEVPTVIGWLRPVILVPLSVLTGLCAQQVEALLAHELAHIRRHDYLVNLLQTALETLLFYHPAVWWVSRRIRVEREHCCDDLAVAACGDVLGYARALTMLEQLRGREAEQFAMAATGGGSLLKRIRRLVGTPASSSPRASSWLAGLVVMLAVLGIFAGARSTLLSRQAAINTWVDPHSFAGPARREVAVTFISLPYMRSYGDDEAMVEKTTRKLLDTIKSNSIPAVGFVGERTLFRYGEKEPRTTPLKMWLDAGLELGNQTFSHKWLYKTPLAEFQEDVLRGEAVTRPLLKARGRELKYFLYPFLNTGPDPETKASFEKFLAERGYTFAPVTIDNMDWLFARVYDEAFDRNDAEMMQRVSLEYVPYMEKMFEFYEKLSVDVNGYEVPQVLMLSASRLNADYLEDLVQMLKRRNYSFISLDAAMKDKAYQQPDKYTGPVGISWLQRWAITKEMGFRKEPPLPPFMRQFDKRSASRSDFKTARAGF
jgi:beta-lactamase regulating signal transducer with metallopeptidase domain/peptidoglycan/xylan/chitin deacetylase (PgdA/CDA1 family)